MLFQKEKCLFGSVRFKKHLYCFGINHITTYLQHHHTFLFILVHHDSFFSHTHTTAGLVVHHARLGLGLLLAAAALRVDALVAHHNHGDVAGEVEGDSHDGGVGTVVAHPLTAARLPTRPTTRRPPPHPMEAEGVDRVDGTRLAAAVPLLLSAVGQGPAAAQRWFAAAVAEGLAVPPRSVEEEGRGPSQAAAVAVESLGDSNKQAGQ